MSDTRSSLLELFEENRGKYISGEAIAEKLHVSRTAIWKAVNSLRSDGYDIDAVTNKGYCLAETSDIMSAEGIQYYLDDSCHDIRVEVFSETDSTNMVCRNKANEGEPEGYVAIAGTQTAGRGRMGRSFYSPADTGIYMSILLKPSRDPGDEIPALTTLAAVAACEAIEEISGKSCGIKWVNDILIDGKKVCGILSEASYALEDRRLFAVVVGFGINVYTPRDGFPHDIKNIAGSLFSRSESCTRNRLAAEIINRFMYYYRNAVKDNDVKKKYIDGYRDRSVVVGKAVEVHSGGNMRPAQALAIGDDCGLTVRYEDGSTETLRFGEVSIKGIY